MRLTNRIISSRANGAKSRGPASEAGKKRSCANSYRHGLLSTGVVLDNESKEIFTAHADQYIAKFKPADDVELGMVEEMIAAQWRLRRMWVIETDLMNRSLHRSTENGETAALSESFTQLGAQLQLLDRYEKRMHRMYARSLHNLLLMQGLEDERAEDTPDPETPSPTPIHDPDETVEKADLPNEPTSEQPVQNQEAESPSEPFATHPDPVDLPFDPFNPIDPRIPGPDVCRDKLPEDT